MHQNHSAKAKKNLKMARNAAQSSCEMSPSLQKGNSFLNKETN